MAAVITDIADSYTYKLKFVQNLQEKYINELNKNNKIYKDEGNHFTECGYEELKRLVVIFCENDLTGERFKIDSIRHYFRLKELDFLGECIENISEELKHEIRIFRLLIEYGLIFKYVSHMSHGDFEIYKVLDVKDLTEDSLNEIFELIRLEIVEEE